MQKQSNVPIGRKLRSQRVLTIDDGEYRVFVSVFLRGQQLSFGFPKDTCRNRKVWVGRDSELVCWLSVTDARANLGSLFKSQCEPALVQCGGCNRVNTHLIAPVVMAKRLLGSFRKIPPDTLSDREPLGNRVLNAARDSSSRAGAKWTTEEDEQIQDEFEQGLSVPQMASTHGRTEVAIRSRLIRLRLIDETSDYN